VRPTTRRARGPRSDRHRRIRITGPLAALAVGATLLSACGGSTPQAAPEPPEPRLEADGEVRGEVDDDGGPADGAVDATTVEGSVIAVATVSTVEVRDRPGGGDVVHRLDHPRPVGAPLTFLVDAQEVGWLEVLLPVRPNGTTGWVAAADVELFETSYLVEVSLADHRLVVRDGDEVVIDTPIGVGGDGTPTPPGRYYVTELLEPPDPSGPYGPYAFGLSGFSDVHLDFAGGEGVIGIHGTDDPSSIGRDSSNGCIRVDNEVITELATMLPLGTPVVIRG
jgi:lipoprotein-anchoring transpeptidase ErfK/SrfK